MPKIIENLPRLLLEETRRQIREKGYAGTTIRSVAAACGVGVGTVYNHFPSKNHLVAAYMLEDWQECLNEMRLHAALAQKEAFEKIYGCLLSFTARHAPLFSDADATKVFAVSFGQYHGMLTKQLQQILLPLCAASSISDKTTLSEFLAESLLSFARKGSEFPVVFPLLSALMR